MAVGFTDLEDVRGTDSLNGQMHMNNDVVLVYKKALWLEISVFNNRQCVGLYSVRSIENSYKWKWKRT